MFVDKNTSKQPRELFLSGIIIFNALLDTFEMLFRSFGSQIRNFFFFVRRDFCLIFTSWNLIFGKCLHVCTLRNIHSPSHRAPPANAVRISSASNRQIIQGKED